MKTDEATIAREENWICGSAIEPKQERFWLWSRHLFYDPNKPDSQVLDRFSKKTMFQD